MGEVGLIRSYLDELARALRVGWLRKRRILREIEDHLHDDCAAAEQAGTGAEEAARQAIARLGPPAALAAGFAEALTDRSSKRQTRALCLPAAAAAVLTLVELAQSLAPPSPVTAALLDADTEDCAAIAHGFLAPRAPASLPKLRLPRAAPAPEPVLVSVLEPALEPATAPVSAPVSVSVLEPEPAASPRVPDLRGLLLAGWGGHTVRVGLPEQQRLAPQAPPNRVATPRREPLASYQGYDQASLQYLLVLIDRRNVRWR